MPIEVSSDGRLFSLTTDNSAYLIRRAESGRLVQLYWGPKLPYPEDYPGEPFNLQLSSFHAYTHDLMAEFPVPVGLQEIEPCLRMVFADGTRDLRLVYTGHEVDEDNQELFIKLKDEFYELEVGLHYRLYPDCDLLARWVEVVNPGPSAVTLEQVLSGSLRLPIERGDFRLTHLAGAWAGETQVERTPVTAGRKVLEGRQHYSGHAANPFFALDLDASESNGEVWFGALAWSGNWKIVVEQARSPYKITRVAAGLNDFDFSLQLEAGQRFETPRLICGYSGAGFGRMSRNLHRYQLRHNLPGRFRETLRPVLYNSWEAVTFDVTEAAQLELAEKAARLGAEVFVVDDGWFGARDNDRAGLGDWQVNLRKFPNGLEPLIERVNGLGMDFGLWVEPEMVNPDSELYRAHPDWVYHFSNRPPTTSRNQLILNLARSDVQAWLFDWLDRLLTDHNIRYLKWDYNRTISEAGWPETPREKQREVWVRHIEALYSLVDRLRDRHPEVLFEACSGGGGRADLGALAHFDHAWASENTDPYDRLFIQQGYSLVYAPKTMYCWVTETDFNRAKYSLSYRFYSSFMGSLGIGSNLNHWGELEFKQAAALVAEYKRIRPLIQHGNFYRLTALDDRERLAVQYLAQDKQAGAVLVFTHQAHFWRNPQIIRLADLEPTALYRLESPEITGGELNMSGQALMYRGIDLQFSEHFSSALVTFKQV